MASFARCVHHMCDTHGGWESAPHEVECVMLAFESWDNQCAASTAASSSAAVALQVTTV
jgi:hypothetical protein